MMTEQTKRLLLLQITDSVFPIGAYSHSYGLETYVQDGLVTGEQDARIFTKNYIKYSLGYTDLPAIRFAYQLMLTEGEQKFSDIFALEERLNAARAAMEIRTAGNKLAARFIKTVSGVIPPQKAAAWTRYTDGCSGNKHQYTVSYAVFCALNDIRLDDCILSYAYGQLSAMVVNCVKIIPLSQTAGQNILYSLHGDIVGAIEASEHISERRFLQAAPGFELRGMQHEALYSRIYMS